MHHRGGTSHQQQAENLELPKVPFGTTSPVSPVSEAAVSDALTRSASQNNSFTLTLPPDASKYVHTQNLGSTAFVLTDPQPASKSGQAKVTATPVSPAQITVALDQTAASIAKATADVTALSTRTTVANTPAWVLAFMAIVTPSNFLLLRLGFSLLVGIVAVVLLVRSDSTTAATNWASGTLGTIVGYWMKFS
jgi:hypothetical protein